MKMFSVERISRSPRVEWMQFLWNVMWMFLRFSESLFYASELVPKREIFPRLPRVSEMRGLQKEAEEEMEEVFLSSSECISFHSFCVSFPETRICIFSMHCFILHEYYFSLFAFDCLMSIFFAVYIYISSTL